MSTLFNALIGERLADMDAPPKTWRIDVFDSSMPAGIAKMRYGDGGLSSAVHLTESFRPRWRGIVCNAAIDGC